MRLPESEPDWQCYKEGQLFFQFGVDLEGGTRSPNALPKVYAPSARDLTSSSEAARRESDGLTSGEQSRPVSARERKPIHLSGRDHELEEKSRTLLRELGAAKLAREVRVKWNPRMRSAAGRADYREKLISLNPLLLEVGARFAGTEPGAGKLDCLKQSSLTSVLGEHERASINGQSGSDEIDRTLRHELAHLLAQWRVGRGRIDPHGPQWRQACCDLGIGDEARCHNLPFATKVLPPRFVYVCPNCKEKFSRVRRIRRAIACLACCRKHNGGDFDPRFRLELTTTL